MKKDVILITGAGGQIGTALLPVFQERYGFEQIIASDITSQGKAEGIYEKLDVTDARSLGEIISKYKITQVYHLAAVLSAKAESDPIRAWHLNMQTFLNVLEAGRQFQLDKIFIPSSIAVFGESAPQENTPQKTYLDPASVYGVSKVAAESWMNYYHRRFKLDIRSLRYPGVVSYQSMPGGGTTDYAVDMFHKALADKNYSCFLKKDTRLPMIYIDDALNAALMLMEATWDKIKIRSSYNLAGLSFTPEELCNAIKKYFPDFQCDYVPDFRQDIAASWPKSIDDSCAREDWGWKPEFGLSRMTEDMVQKLSVVQHSFR